MNIVFYLSALVAIFATAMVITRANAMHALLYMIVSLLAVAIIFYTLGAPFVAALEVIVYAGAIMVLFIFAIMLLNQGTATVTLERQWLRASSWVGPAVLSAILLVEVIYILASGGAAAAGTPAAPVSGATAAPIEPRLVGAALYTTYLIGVELASVLLLAALVGAYHLGRRRQVTREVQRDEIELTKSKELKEGEHYKSASTKTVEENSQYEVEKER